MQAPEYHGVPTVDEEERADGGWSLVEMMVAVGLLAILTMLLAHAVTSVRGTLASTASVSRQAAIEAVGRHLRHVIAGAIPLARPEAGPRQPRLAGGSRFLEFVSTYAPQGQYDGLYVVRLALAPSSKPGRFDLVEFRTLYRQRSAREKMDPEAPQTHHVLLEDVADVMFGYLGRRAGGESERAWQDTWDSRSAMPEMISVDVSFGPGDRRYWSKLIVALPSR